MLATYLKFFSVFKFCNNSDLSDFYPQKQFLCELFLKEIG